MKFLSRFSTGSFLAVFSVLLTAFTPERGAAQSSFPPPPPANLISPAHLLDPTHLAEPWVSLLAALHKKGNVRSSFTEERFVPFKKQPLVFTGEIRLSAERGLSLHYLTPKDRRMTVDQEGVLLRDAAGHSRTMPSDPKALAATTALLQVLRFDFVDLARHFQIYAAGDAQTWYFAFDPKDDPIGQALKRLVVTGQGEEVREIVIGGSAKEKIRIVIGKVDTGVTFSPAELKQFFR